MTQMQARLYKIYLIFKYMYILCTYTLTTHTKYMYIQQIQVHLNNKELPTIIGLNILNYYTYL